MLFRAIVAGAICCLAMLPAGCSRKAENLDAPTYALLDSIGKAELLHSPEQAGRMGVSPEIFGGRYDDMLDDRSIAAAERARLVRLDDLQALESIHRGSLSPAARRSLDIAQTVVAEAVDVSRYGYGYVSLGATSPYVINPSDGAYAELVRTLTLSQPIGSHADADAWLARLRKVGAAMEDERRRFEIDMKAGATPPATVLRHTLEQVKALSPASARSNLFVDYFYTALSALPDLTEDEISRLIDEASKIVQDDISPAYKALAGTLEKALVGASDDPGVWRLPKGEDYYKDALRIYTTTDMTPEQVHDMGEKLVADISGQMNEILVRIGLPDGSVGARMNSLSTDPARLYPDTDEGRAALLAALDDKLAWASQHANKVLAALPKGKVDVRQAPALVQATAPGGYYKKQSLDGKREAAFIINLRSTLEWPIWSLPTLAFHEGIPGHHVQSGLSREAPAPSLIQLAASFPAYSEGWGTYAEDLADEMGAYENDPEARLGYLQSLLFRAARLVVDTGIHSERWTRQEAVDYLVSTTGLPRAAMETEIDRYIIWPGQACAYMIGREKIRALRVQADTELGPDFDLKQFHTVILNGGGRPLGVLEADVHDWIASKRKPAAAG